MLTIECDFLLDGDRAKIWNDIVAVVPRVGERVLLGAAHNEFEVVSVTHALRVDETENVQRVQILVR